jgi:hypothetical protein
MTPKKIGGRLFGFSLGAYRFLSISTIINVATAMATIMPTVAGSKYISAVDGGGGVGVGEA